MFAVPMPLPTFGLHDYTLDEIRLINVKTRKVLISTDNFHMNSDRLPLPKSKTRKQRFNVTSYPFGIIV